jgi:hypothetical protein
MFFLKNGEHIQIEDMTYLDSCTDITDDFHEATYKKYWVKLKDDMNVQSMFRSVKFEKKIISFLRYLKKNC